MGGIVSTWLGIRSLSSTCPAFPELACKVWGRVYLVADMHSAL